MLPLIYQGGGKFSVISTYHARRADRLYGEGQEVLFEEIEPRSMNSHKHYFARLKELWETLPEALADDFPSPEHLRKFALVRTGHCTMKKLTFVDNKAAIEAAALLESLGTFIIVEVVMRVLTVWLPDSQSVRAMSRDRFQKSKDDVLQYCERLVASEPGKVIPFGRQP